jgi:F0F1-type ATP synthase assembly protein I
MDYKKIAKAFVIQSIVLVIILCLCCSIASMVWGYDLLTDKMVSTLFVLIVDISSALIWRRLAEHQPDMLPTFFTAVSGFRFLLALVVMFVWYLATNRQAIITFFVVFLIFYFVSLIHHSIFFSRVSNRL